MSENNNLNRTYFHPYEALSLVVSNSSKIESEAIKLKDAYNRVLTNNVYAKYDDPPFNKSSMDGYAYNSKDNRKTFNIVEDIIIQAGDSKDIIIPDGSAVKIMTGAKLPSPCNKVQRIEWTNKENKNITFTKNEISSNIIKQGENISTNSLILNKKILKPKDIAILASGGFRELEVYKKMKVAVFSTGREIIDIEKEIEESKIYDSNGYMLFSSLTKLGCDATFFGIIDDNEQAIKQAIEKTILNYDLIILSGGVSMGDYDLIPKALYDLKLRQIFHGLKMKPGKPCYFGKINNKAIFALPGNPLSSFVCFNVFVRNYILSSMDLNSRLNIIKAEITIDYSRKDFERFEFIPSFIDITSGRVLASPIVAKSSSMLQVLNNANSFIIIGAGESKYKKNSEVSVMLLE